MIGNLGSAFDARDAGRPLRRLDRQELVAVGSGNWNAVAGTLLVFSAISGAGGGGGAGRLGLTLTARGGGGSGATGSWSTGFWYINELGLTVPYTVPAGGAGAPAVTGAAANGGTGTAGGTAIFGPLSAGGGNGGPGATTAGGAAGDIPTPAHKGSMATPPLGIPPLPVVGGNDGSAGGNGTGALVVVEGTPYGTGRSGGGGGVTAANLEQAGRPGAFADNRFGTAVAGGAGGTVGGGVGGNGLAGITSRGGSGAGGGGSSALSTVPGGAGGNGGNYGAAGGGGGGGTILVAAGASGAGGNGAQGIVIVECWGY